jgi:tetratricopeptide (TPR) repeat protein
MTYKTTLILLIAVSVTSTAISCRENSKLQFSGKMPVSVSLEDWQRAIDQCDSALNENPKDYWALFWRGYAEGHIPHYQVAMVNFTEAISIKPDLQVGYHWRGFVKLRLGDFRGALHDFSKALELNAKDGESYRGRGEAELQLSQKENACEDFSRAGELGSDVYNEINRYCN